MITKEDIILLFLENPQKLVGEITKGNVLKSDEIRTLICDLGDPECAYYYAAVIDKKPTDETRNVVHKDAYESIWYALEIERKPRDDTRTACCTSSGYAYLYARDIDKKPTEETRNAAYKSSFNKKRYISWENECLLKKT